MEFWIIVASLIVVAVSLGAFYDRRVRRRRGHPAGIADAGRGKVLP